MHSLFWGVRTVARFIDLRELKQLKSGDKAGFNFRTESMNSATGSCLVPSNELSLHVRAVMEAAKDMPCRLAWKGLLSWEHPSTPVLYSNLTSSLKPQQFRDPSQRMQSLRCGPLILCPELDYQTQRVLNDS